MTDSKNTSDREAKTLFLSRWHEESKETNNKTQDFAALNTTLVTKSKGNLTYLALGDPGKGEKDAPLSSKSLLPDDNKELNIRRREYLRAELHASYRHLCSALNPITTQLICIKPSRCLAWTPVLQKY
ncbi:hypothetical protein AC249_AIPGENE11189 [Exaiptasia diaphana]|nr:hypothetical protein AC249_AIPGENE11189 [Exaiptasia diaphana]